MELKKYGGVFSFDKEKTEEYYKNRDDSLCSCENCKYYYAHIKGMFPKLESILSDFGVDIEKPDEVWSGDMKKENVVMIFEAGYTVCGSIVGELPKDIEIDDGQKFALRFSKGFAFPNGQTGDYFSISVMGFKMYRPMTDAPKEEIFLEKTDETKKTGIVEKIKRLFKK